MTWRRAAATLAAIAGAAALVACGGNVFSVVDAGSSGSASGSSSGASASGGGTGAPSGASAGGESGAASGSHSGSTGSSGAASTGGASGASGASGGTTDAGPATMCPIVAPNIGAICPKVGLECEYGTSADVRCNQVAVCQAAGWAYNPATPCPKATCPLTYDDIVAGSRCSPVDETCAYTKGTCICASSLGGPVRLTDAGVETDWSCFEGTLACRSPRPIIGSVCNDDTRTCDYGACLGGVELLCSGGLWQEQQTECAQAN
jgi:hypothetical protein